MMNRLRTIPAAASGLLALIASMMIPVSASARIKWIESHYNFGAIKEADGPVDGFVRLVNTGEGSTFIRSVRPSCGCTAVSFTEDDIQPGDTATVSFTFDPTGRPGKFEKTIRVVTGTDDDLWSIKLYGTVIASDETLGIAFPVEAGALRLEKDSISAGDMRRYATRHLFVNAYNQSADTISPKWTESSPAIITDLSPRRIPPGESATFSFTIKGENEDDFGPKRFNVDILSDGPGSPEANISIGANFTVDPSGMTASELESMPYAILLPEFIDLGDVAPDTTVKFSFEILNEGKGKLSVRKIIPAAKAVTVSSFPSSVKGGKKGKVAGKFHASELKPGPFRINIEILTDDLLHPVRTARVVGEIK